ncbi:flagellar hook-associated protein FlgK [Pseudochelatococcus sp. B33]
MSLNAALNSAQLSLQASQKRIAVSARNVAGANDPNYSRKLSPLVMLNGGVYVAGPVRAGDARLYERYLESTSVSAREQALLAGLTRFSETVGDTRAGTSLVGRLGALTDKLTEYVNAPADDNLARAAVTSAKDLARALNAAAAVVDEVRSGAVADVKMSVDRINTLLKDFERANTAIVQGSVTDADITDELDRRDAIVAQLSEDLGISVVMRANNDMVLYTDSGVTLFETSAREVRADTPAGQPVRVFIDGVQVAGLKSDVPQMPLRNGKLAGLVELHNDVAAAYANQLDTLAFGLIQAFREVDPADPPVEDPLPGLFINGDDAADLPVDPPADITGLARAIAVNPRVDPAADPAGRPSLLRDGINGAYDYNTEGAPAFAGQLSRLLGQLDAKDTARLDGKSALDYAAMTVSWVESSRQASDSAARANDAVLQLVTTSLSNARGVNFDDETALQLQLEQQYVASARLIAVVDTLFKTLLDAVR